MLFDSSRNVSPSFIDRSTNFGLHDFDDLSEYLSASRACRRSHRVIRLFAGEWSSQQYRLEDDTLVVPGFDICATLIIVMLSTA